MKKTFVTIVILLSAISVYSQFKKGDIDISGGIGFGIYGASGNDTSDSNTGIQAACVILNLSSNYSIDDKFLIGLNLERNGYAVANDSGSSEPYVHSLNARINAGYRLANNEKNSFAVIGQMGYSGIKFGDKNSSDKVTSSGLGYGLGIDWQNMTSEKVGIFFKGGWYVYSHSKFIDQDGIVWKRSTGGENIKVSFHGVNLNAGLVFKI